MNDQRTRGQKDAADQQAPEAQQKTRTKPQRPAPPDEGMHPKERMTDDPSQAPESGTRDPEDNT
ncbi:MAG: hypothetical protein J0I06_04975 [Planctomycetes bacterium]|nr:hypothetical protein [Planctomycetota bacterium]